MMPVEVVAIYCDLVEPDSVKMLECPHCGGDLRVNGASLICSRGHTANIARQGYVSLLGRDSGTHTADDAEMVAARTRVQEAGLFEPLAAAMAECLREPSLAGVPGAVVDLGSGPGYYLAAALEALPGRSGLAIDNSKYAARRAARCHERAAAVVADIWDGLPVRSGSAAAVINVFAPRNGDEIARILAPGGRLVVATPEPGHLAELAEPFSMISVDPEKEERLERSIAGVGGRLRDEVVTWLMEVSPAQATDLVAMGPSAGRLGEEGADAALAQLDFPLAVTGSVRVTVVERTA
jgi:23S rRNA (guanine745-N1)-methyltransferase